MAAWQLVEAALVARGGGIGAPVAAQNLYNLLDRSAEPELISVCARYGIGLIPHTPLAGGLLTGKYRQDQSPPAGARLADRPAALTSEAYARLATLERIAAARGVDLLTLSIAGLLAQPVVASVIVGATSPEQLRANVAAADVKLSPEDLD
jgi:aryl-alcohol dehydrogenase-like predicted oxidoreductase